jgi:hypothetical protein
LGIPPIPSCRIRRILAVGSSVQEERVSKATVMVVLHRGSSKAVGSGRRYLLSPNHRDEPDWTRTDRTAARSTHLSYNPNVQLNGIESICNSRVSDLEQMVWPDSSSYVASGNRAGERRHSFEAIRNCFQTFQDACDALLRRAAMTASTTASNAFPS